MAAVTPTNLLRDTPSDPDIVRNGAILASRYGDPSGAFNTAVSKQSAAVSADTTFAISTGQAISGLYQITWSGPSRYHSILFFVNALPTASRVVIIDEAAQGVVFTNLKATASGPDNQIVCTIGNRNGGTGTIKAIAFGQAPQLDMRLTTDSFPDSVATANISAAASGPASSTDSALAAFDGTTGKLLKNSSATIASGIITALGFRAPPSVGFENNGFTANALNKIWHIAGLDYGFSYFQGSAGFGGQDTVGYYFGTPTIAGSSLLITSGGIKVNGVILGNGAGITSIVGVQSASPTTGQTVSVTNDSQTRTLYLTPASTLASLTVNLPSNANSEIGQIIRIFTTQEITSFTLANATTIIGTPSSLDVNTCTSFQKFAANTWGVIATS